MTCDSDTVGACTSDGKDIKKGQEVYQIQGIELVKRIVHHVSWGEIRVMAGGKNWTQPGFFWHSTPSSAWKQEVEIKEAELRDFRYLYEKALGLEKNND